MPRNKNSNANFTRRKNNKPKLTNRANAGSRYTVTEVKKEVGKVESKVNAILHKQNQLIPPPQRRLVMPKMKGKNGSQYINMVMNPLNSNTVLFPYYGWDPYHVTKRTFAVTIPVNASGCCFIEVAPSLLASCSKSLATANGYFPFIALNHATYNTVEFSNASAWNLVNAPGFTTDIRNGLLDSTDHHYAITTAFHCKITATGVSTTNRQGLITVIEYVDDQEIYVANNYQIPNSNTNFGAYIAARPFSAMINRPKNFSRDLATAYTNSIDYTWVPNYSSHSIPFYEYDLVNNATYVQEYRDSSNTLKKMLVYVQGAAPSTQIRLEMTVVYQTQPQHDKITSFPIAYSEDYTDVTIPLMRMSRTMRIKETENSGNHAYVGQVVYTKNGPLLKNGPDDHTGDNDNQIYLNDKTMITEYEDTDDMYIYIDNQKENKQYVPEFKHRNKVDDDHKHTMVKGRAKLNTQ